MKTYDAKITQTLHAGYYRIAFPDSPREVRILPHPGVQGREFHFAVTETTELHGPLTAQPLPCPSGDGQQRPADRPRRGKKPLSNRKIRVEPAPSPLPVRVVPRSRGGSTTWENIVCACVACNVRKGGRTPAEARRHLSRQPVKPKRSPLLSIKLGNPKYASWKSFVDNAYWLVGLR